MTAREHTRRLINLIFAGSRMVMIRRELPRTKSAGWVRGPFRIEAEEGSPFRGLRAATGSAVPFTFFYAACESFCLCSVFTPIAQMNPSSSRPRAVTIWFLFFPRPFSAL